MHLNLAYFIFVFVTGVLRLGGLQKQWSATLASNLYKENTFPDDQYVACEMTINFFPYFKTTYGTILIGSWCTSDNVRFVRTIQESCRYRIA